LELNDSMNRPMQRVLSLPKPLAGLVAFIVINAIEGVFAAQSPVK